MKVEKKSATSITVVSEPRLDSNKISSSTKMRRFFQEFGKRSISNTITSFNGQNLVKKGVNWTLEPPRWRSHRRLRVMNQQSIRDRLATPDEPHTNFVRDIQIEEYMRSSQKNQVFPYKNSIKQIILRAKRGRSAKTIKNANTMGIFSKINVNCFEQVNEAVFEKIMTETLETSFRKDEKRLGVFKAKLLKQAFIDLYFEFWSSVKRKLTTTVPEPEPPLQQLDKFCVKIMSHLDKNDFIRRINQGESPC